MIPKKPRNALKDKPRTDVVAFGASPDKFGIFELACCIGAFNSFQATLDENFDEQYMFLHYLITIYFNTINAYLELAILTRNYLLNYCWLSG